MAGWAAPLFSSPFSLRFSVAVRWSLPPPLSVYDYSENGGEAAARGGP